MDMFPEKDLYRLYKKHVREEEFSSAIPEVTKKRTLELMNVAVQCAEDWKLAVDIGGGNGHYSVPLIHKFGQVLLIEPDVLPEHTHLEQEHTNFSVIHSFIEDAEMPASPDLILLADLFEHVPDVEGFIAKLSSLQSKGGVIHIMTPNPVSCGPAIRSGIHHSLAGSHGHIRHYFKNEVEDILARHGYYLIHHSYEESPLRAPMRQMVRGISRRDKRWSRWFPYRLVRPLVHLALTPLITLVESLVYTTEYAHRDDIEKCLSSVFIFKKS